MGLKFLYLLVLIPDFLSSDVTCPIFVDARNRTALNDALAICTIITESSSQHALRSDVGSMSIGDVFVSTD